MCTVYEHIETDNVQKGLGHNGIWILLEDGQEYNMEKSLLLFIGQ